jgi:cell division protein FtsB
MIQAIFRKRIQQLEHLLKTRVMARDHMLDTCRHTIDRQEAELARLRAENDRLAKLVDQMEQGFFDVARIAYKFYDLKPNRRISRSE